MFKVGDKVRCIREDNGQFLIVGRLYTIDMRELVFASMYYGVEGNTETIFPEYCFEKAS
jgi:hypothetical protein